MTNFENWIQTTPFLSKGLYSTETPENSIAAIRKAVEKGYGVHLDVRALADNTIVVFRDETLGRMTGTDGFISHYSYEDIKNLTLLKSSEHIPTLLEALEAIDGKVPVIIEIKNLDKVNYEKYVWKILKDYKGEYAVASVNPYSLEWFKLNAPKVKRGQISQSFKGTSLPLFTKLAYRKMKFNKDVSEPNFIMYKSQDLPCKYTKKYKDLPLLGYHINSTEEYVRVKKYVKNVILDGIEMSTTEDQLVTNLV